MLHHDPRLAYSLFCSSRLVLRDGVCGKKQRRIRSRRRGPRTRQRNGEGHRSPSGVTTIPSYGLGRRSGLGGLVSRRPLVPPHSQRFVVVVTREVDNMRRSYKENVQSNRVATNVQSTQSGTSVIIPGLEVTASSISWLSSLVEISEVAALQASKVSRLAQWIDQGSVHDRQRKTSFIITQKWWGRPSLSWAEPWAAWTALRAGAWEHFRSA